MRKSLSKSLICALSSMILAISSSVEAMPHPNNFNPTLPYHSEELYCYHSANLVNFADCKLGIEDGSEWKVCEADRSQLLSWRSNDYVVITPNKINSDFTFYITNQANGSYVRANLVKGPAVGGYFTMVISGLDANSRSKRSIYLNNGTAWGLDSADFYTIDNWQIGDPIIIGRNDSWFTSNKTILINVLTNTFVHARKL